MRFVVKTYGKYLLLFPFLFLGFNSYAQNDSQETIQIEIQKFYEMSITDRAGFLANAEKVRSLSKDLLAQEDESLDSGAFYFLRALDEEVDVEIILSAVNQDSARLDLAISTLSGMCNSEVEIALKELLKRKQRNAPDIWSEYNHEFHGLQSWYWYKATMCKEK